MEYYTSILEQKYGQNVRDWTLISNLARYLSIVRYSDNYQGWPLKWEEWTSQSHIWQVNSNAVNEVAMLYDYIANNDNLRVTSAPMTENAFNRVPTVLNNFGLQVVAETETLPYRICDYIEANATEGYPTLFQYTNNDGKIYSMTIDAVKEYTRDVLAHYNNYPDVNYHLWDCYYHMTDGIADWFLNSVAICPSRAQFSQPKVNPFYNPTPYAHPDINNPKVINVSGFNY